MLKLQAKDLTRDIPKIKNELEKITEEEFSIVGLNNPREEDWETWLHNAAVYSYMACRDYKKTVFVETRYVKRKIEAMFGMHQKNLNLKVKE